MTPSLTTGFSFRNTKVTAFCFSRTILLSFSPFNRKYNEFMYNSISLLTVIYYITHLRNLDINLYMST